MDKREVTRVALISGAILCLPVIGMMVSDEVNWGIGDFVIGGVILFAFGLLIQLALNQLKGKKYKWLVVFLILIVLVLLWAELAVGIFR